jgi:hypothetical protein
VAARDENAIVLAAAGVGSAAVPHAFKPGDVVSASAMNENFTELDQRIDKKNRFVAQIGGGPAYSMGATTFCGNTAPTAGRFMSGATKIGYPAAKAQCEAVAGCSPSAHMCTLEEVVRLAQMGVGPPAPGWVGSGVVAPTAGPTQETGDCGGWSHDGPVGAIGEQGYIWTGTFTAYNSCSTQQPILCCD